MVYVEQKNEQMKLRYAVLLYKCFYYAVVNREDTLSILQMRLNAPKPLIHLLKSYFSGRSHNMLHKSQMSNE